MINQLISAVDFLRTLVYNTFYYSFKIGQFIIFLFKLCTDLVVLLLKGLNVLLISLSESFSVFSEDISHAIQQVAGFIALVSEEFQKIINILLFIIEVVVGTFMLIHKFFNDALQSILTLITQCAVHSKHLMILFGAGVWFIITFLPLCVYNIAVLLTNGIINISQEIGIYTIELSKNFKLSLKELYIFITDVPVESLIGLLVTISLIYIFTQFYVTIFACINQQMLRLLLKLRRFINYARRIRLPSLRTNPTLERRFPQVRRSLSSPVPQVKTNLNQSRDDLCCVICQERLKCILLLPCRHVCMCSECNTRLQMYDRSCPVCRNEIEETMRIFV